MEIPNKTKLDFHKAMMLFRYRNQEAFMPKSCMEVYEKSSFTFQNLVTMIFEGQNKYGK